MNAHTPRLSEADRELRNAAELQRARGILADAAHHSDPEIATACDAILTLTRDAGDLSRAKQWQEILANDP